MPSVQSQHTKQGRSGMGLLEVTIAAGIASGLMLAMAQSMKQSSSIAKRIALSSDWSNLISAMRRAYNDSNICTNTFSGKTYNEGTDLVLTDLKAIGSGGSTLATFITVGKPVGSIYGLSLKMKQYPGSIKRRVTVNGKDLDFNRVYLDIKAKKFTDWVPPANLNQARADLSAGDSMSDPNLIVFAVYTDPASGNKIQQCTADYSGCSDLDQDANYLTDPNGTNHVNHNHKACQVNTFNVNPRGAFQTSSIVFGDPYKSNNSAGTTPLSNSPDSITDDATKKMLTLSASTLTLSSTTVSLNATTVGVTGNLGIGTTSPDKQLDIKSTGNAVMSLTGGNNTQGWISRFTNRLQINASDLIAFGLGNDTTQNLTLSSTGLWLSGSLDVDLGSSNKFGALLGKNSDVTLRTASPVATWNRFLVGGQLAIFPERGTNAAGTEGNPTLLIKNNDVSVTGNLNVSNDVSVTGDLTVNGKQTMKGSLEVQGFDIQLGTSGRGDTGSSRALVKEDGGWLTINYNNDFSAGTYVNSNLLIQKDLTVRGKANLRLRQKCRWHRIWYNGSGNDELRCNDDETFSGLEEHTDSEGSTDVIIHSEGPDDDKKFYGEANRRGNLGNWWFEIFCCKIVAM